MHSSTLRTLRPAHASRLLHKRRTWYDGDPTPNPTPGANGGPSGDAKPTVSFTPEQQAAINDLIADRLSRRDKADQNAAITAFLQGLGVEKADDLKARLSRLKEIEEKDLTELDKLKRDVESERATRAKLEADFAAYRTQIEQQQRLAARDARITALARDAKASAPEDVIAWAERNAADALGKVLKDDGAVDDAAVKALVELCKAARPAWFAAVPRTPGSPPIGASTTPAPKPTDDNRPKWRL